jgi:hypothetical protein
VLGTRDPNYSLIWCRVILRCSFLHRTRHCPSKAGGLTPRLHPGPSFPWSPSHRFQTISELCLPLAPGPSLQPTLRIAHFLRCLNHQSVHSFGGAHTGQVTHTTPLMFATAAAGLPSFSPADCLFFTPSSLSQPPQNFLLTELSEGCPRSVAFERGSPKSEPKWHRSESFLVVHLSQNPTLVQRFFSPLSPSHNSTALLPTILIANA